ncbi:alkaline phosphatase D family protein [Mumia sp. Pv 4-285]|uniref:alkaline phosphatase D family protein n=1 Tax=Mumia qirimensis TaxID=3234852 RepID=UPI00351D219F
MISSTPPRASSKSSLPSFATADSLTRRRALAVAGGSAAGLAFALSSAGVAHAGEGSVERDPFTLGVASGDPTPTSVLLWTRLAPEPVAIGSGLDPRRRYPVMWEVATDERFRRTVARGVAMATAEENFSVHVDVRGLQPGRPYWYRFRSGRHVSTVGRTQTTPSPRAAPHLRFAFASCMNYRAGYFQTMRDMAERDLDLILFLGDYLYEYPVQQLPVGRTIPSLPAEVLPMTTTLDQYRLRYALYKLDPDLQAAHHAAPWIVTWDDHEVSNDYETDAPDDLLRRAAAYRAYWENMPLRRPHRPRGSDARLYRRLAWGSMAQFDILDTRQYRDPMAGGSTTPDVGERRNPTRTVLGREQERWFAGSFGMTPVRWNFVGQQLLMARLNTAAAEGAPTTFSAGTWDGYQASQQRMFDVVSDGLDSGRVRNFCSLGGDVHTSYVSNLISDSLDPGSPLIGVDITSPSITSAQDFNPVANEARQVRRRMNPTLRWADLHCGYDICDVTAERAEFEVRVVDKVSVPDSPVYTGARFTVEDRVPGFAEG